MWPFPMDAPSRRAPRNTTDSRLAGRGSASFPRCTRRHDPPSRAIRPMRADTGLRCQYRQHLLFQGSGHPFHQAEASTMGIRRPPTDTADRCPSTPWAQIPRPKSSRMTGLLLLGDGAMAERPVCRSCLVDQASFRVCRAPVEALHELIYVQ
jgi:hypothetical protein